MTVVGEVTRVLHLPVGTNVYLTYAAHLPPGVLDEVTRVLHLPVGTNVYLTYPAHLPPGVVETYSHSADVLPEQPCIINCGIKNIKKMSPAYKTAIRVTYWK